MAACEGSRGREFTKLTQPPSPSDATLDSSFPEGEPPSATGTVGKNPHKFPKTCDLFLSIRNDVVLNLCVGYKPALHPTGTKHHRFHERDVQRLHPKSHASFNVQQVKGAVPFYVSEKGGYSVNFS